MSPRRSCCPCGRPVLVRVHCAECQAAVRNVAGADRAMTARIEAKFSALTRGAAVERLPEVGAEDRSAADR
jgi:hypothetical protein